MIASPRCSALCHSRDVAALAELAAQPSGYNDAARSVRVARRTRVRTPNDLTDREVGVLRMLARGLSNREIDGALVPSPRTVQHHLARVYARIDLHARAGAAVFAVEHGLVPGADS